MTDQIPFNFDVPSVSELTKKIKYLLESNFQNVLVEGELSNVNQSRSGHFYFTVKDSEAQLPCVMWRSTADRLGSRLVDGQQVVLSGNLQVYPPHGRYQLIVTLVEQAGMGKLQQAFEKLKAKLRNEGLFDEKKKKTLPEFPEKIGVVTSSSGAAFQDIRSTLEGRWPLARVYLYHASVQGVNAAPELLNGIQYFCKPEDERVDLLIIGRGGGSLEDLWPFNEESVARAIFNCPVPVISAVGHETDFSISDFVADVRAATPTQAAVIATPDIHEIRFMIEDLSNGLSSRLNEMVSRYRETVRRLSGAHALLVVENRIKNQAELIKNLQVNLSHRFERETSLQKELIRDFRNRIEQLTASRVSVSNEKLTSIIHRLEKQDPNGPLDKGFVRIWQKDSWIKKAAVFEKKEPFDIEWKDGRQTLNQDS